MNWIRKNWFLLFLLVIIVLLLNDRLLGVSVVGPRTGSFDSGIGMTQKAASLSIPSFNSAPPTSQSDRMTVVDTNLSLVVTDVSKAIDKISDTVKNLGGYIVSSSVNKPDSASTGNIVIRVPEDKRDQAVSSLKGVASKVISENVSGADVTDEYVDIGSRLAILQQTQKRYDDLMSKAVTVTDVLSVQRELSSLQGQIDQLKGEQKYLEQTAKLSKITAYLSTDEISLPYYPDKAWRPAVVFKHAVRSLISSVRGLGNLTIWVLVYAPIWLIVLAVYLWLKKRRTVSLTDPQNT